MKTEHPTKTTVLCNPTTVYVFGPAGSIVASWYALVGTPSRAAAVRAAHDMAKSRNAE